MYRSHENDLVFFVVIHTLTLIDWRILLMIHGFSFDFLSLFERVLYDASSSIISTNLFWILLNVSFTLLYFSKSRLFISSRSFKNVSVPWISISKFSLSLVLTYLFFLSRVSLIMTKFGIWFLCTYFVWQVTAGNIFTKGFDKAVITKTRYIIYYNLSWFQNNLLSYP